MIKLVYSKKECKSYKDFYEKICVDLKLEENIDMCELENLCYRADFLNEFLWYNYTDDLRFIFIGYDREGVKNYKTIEDYKWNLIFEVVEEFCERYPNNTVEYRESEEDR